MLLERDGTPVVPHPVSWGLMRSDTSGAKARTFTALCWGFVGRGLSVVASAGHSSEL
jgi:hypothetical protein